MAQETLANTSIAPEYQPRYDLEAEMGLLGSIILDDSVLGEIHNVLEKDHFYDTRHPIIYETMLDLFDERTPIDFVTLKNQLEKKGAGLFDKIGGLDYLTMLAESVSSPGNAIYYAKIIREKFILRRVMEGCHEILKEACQANIESEPLLDKAQQIIFEIASKKESFKAIHIKDILKDTFETYIMTVRERKGMLSGLATGLTELDEILGGLQGGQLIIVAGRPGTGKSSFGLRLIEQVGINDNKALALFTLEVTRQQVVQNLLCSYNRIDGQKLRKGFVSNEEINQLLLSAGKIEQANILIDDASALTPFDLRSRCRRLKAEHDIQLVVVDYLQLMMMKDAESREREIANISYSLKSLAKELNIPVVAMAQLSRAPEQRDAKQPKPRLSDLRESGTIEQDADIVLLLYRDELYHPTNPDNENLCEMMVAKNRNGPVGNIKVLFQKQFTRFENYYQKEEE
jgi:replicative DNA helicase